MHKSHNRWEKVQEMLHQAKTMDEILALNSVIRRTCNIDNFSMRYGDYGLTKLIRINRVCRANMDGQPSSKTIAERLDLECLILSEIFNS